MGTGEPSLWDFLRPMRMSTSSSFSLSESELEEEFPGEISLVDVGS
jgi:hypothetical protein